MDIKVIFNDGRELLRKNVLALDYVDEEDVRCKAEDFGITLTEKQVARIGSIFDQMCNYPSPEDIDDVIRKVAEEEE